MNRLSTEKRARILHLLVEGMSMRAITRIERVGINTVARIITAAGEAAAAYHDEYVRGITGQRRIECDEIWSFVYAKQKNVPYAKAPPPDAGDAWTFTAIDANSKLLVSYFVGERDSESALAFMDDLQGRLEDRPQISTDGLRAYVPAVWEAFGGDVDFAQIIKEFETRWWRDGGRYSPAEVVNVEKRRIFGDPDLKTAGTSYVERSNLTLRMGNRRFTRLTNAFSKRVEKHLAMLHLFFLYYNWCRVHQSLGTTPALAAGLADCRGSFEWIVSMMDERAPKPNRPKTYRKRAA